MTHNIICVLGEETILTNLRNLSYNETIRIQKKSLSLEKEESR